VEILAGVKRIAVLGAGLMGHGIAQVAAQVGKYDVNLRDIEQRFVDSGMSMMKESLNRFIKKGQLSKEEMKAVLGRIHPMLDLKESVSNADIVVEAAPENPELKKRLFSGRLTRMLRLTP
jgi:enoyl-CoA hydratase/3-hydroxyacyl-CoA dehydrogenase